MRSTIPFALALLMTAASSGAQEPSAGLRIVAVVPAANQGEQQASDQAIQYGERATIQVASAPVFLYPDTTRVPLTTLKRGTVVRVLEVEGNWVQVEFQDPQFDKRIGYIERKNIVLPRREVALVTPPTAAPPAAEAKPPVKPAADAPPPKQPTGTTKVPDTKPPARTAPEPTPLQAKPTPVPRSPKSPGPFWMVLGRVGYFVAADPAFKDIYRNGVAYGAELRVGPPDRSRWPIAAWLEGNYRTRSGNVSFTRETTRVEVTSAEAGVIYRITRGRLSPYAGVGGGYYMFRENNEPFGVAKQNKAGFCGVAGVSDTVAKRFALDFRVKYSAVRMQPADFAIKVGGATVGLGVGVRF